MANKFFRFGQRTINWLFGLLFGLTTIFALISPNLIVGDNSITGAGTTIVTAIVIIAVIALLLGLYAFPQFRALCHTVFVRCAPITATVLILVVVAWQILFVSYLHPPIGWDAGALHQTLTNTTSANLRSYYSQNYNNLPVLLLMHWFATVFHSTTWLTFDYITLVLVDLSAAFNILTIAVVSRRHVTTAMYVHVVWLAFFPTIIVPYTDAWVLPLVSLILLSSAFLMMGPGRWVWRLPAAVVLAAATVGAYFIKPSAIVPLIAIVAVVFLFAFKKETVIHWRQLFVTLIVLMGCFGAGYGLINHAVNQQSFIEVDQSRAIPAIHFISMGVSGEGGYNAKDALAMAMLPTKKARSDYSMKKLKQRLRKMGPFGYIAFLFKKHRNNTADGSFAWDKEGSFIDENPKPTPGPGIKNHLQQFVYLYGTNLGDFRWVTQVIWVFGLLLILFAWDDQRGLIQVLRVSVIGAFLYLLIFEGGRSRYLIQYLPAFLLLITLVAERSLKRWRQLFTWSEYPETDE